MRSVGLYVRQWGSTRDSGAVREVNVAVCVVSGTTHEGNGQYVRQLAGLEGSM